MYTVQKLKNLKFQAHPNKEVVMLKYKTGKYTREQIHKICQKYSNDLKEANFNGEIEVCLPYGKKYKAGKFTEVGKPVNLWSFGLYKGDEEEDPEYYKDFIIFTVNKGKKVGKTDKNNDCLYNCLIDFIPNEMKKNFRLQKV
jgi:hypothetical protein